MRGHRIDIAVPAPEQLAALVARHASACWLDSALSGHPRSRFSLVTLRPLRRFTVTAPEELFSRLREWDRLLASLRSDPEKGEFFSGGMVGFLGYPSGRFAAALPAAEFFLVDSGIRIDHRKGSASIFSLGLREDLRSYDSDLAAERCVELQKILANTSVENCPPPRLASFRALLTRDAYLAKVRDIQARIVRGDCYQVNFSQRFSAEGAWHPADLYLRLRAASPAPQMAFFNLGESQILSASPETLLEVEGRTVRSFPIKGTRPRDPDPDEDRRLAQELLRSPKDAAELLMIVDLVRNDLGRCCETGSIRVPELKAIDSLPQVHHLYARVEGILKPGLGPLEALATLSPGGSITGAPKLKAMEVIEELEDAARGIYTGSIGYAGFDGRAGFNIAIRSAAVQGSTLEYSAGGGIVADSDPASEYEECLHKARGLFAALGAEPRLR